MTKDRLKDIFKSDDYEHEFLKFERVENKASQRPDLHAFLLLDKLVPGTRDIISSAEHDEFYLEIDLDALCAVITEEQVVELRRCGVSLNTGYDYLYMFT